MSSDVNFMLSDAKNRRKSEYEEPPEMALRMNFSFRTAEEIKNHFRRNKMKKILKAVASTLMTGISAFVISGMTGSTCVFLLHQPELPEQLDQLRK